LSTSPKVPETEIVLARARISKRTTRLNVVDRANCNRQRTPGPPVVEHPSLDRISGKHGETGARHAHAMNSANATNFCSGL